MTTNFARNLDWDSNERELDVVDICCHKVPLNNPGMCCVYYRLNRKEELISTN